MELVSRKSSARIALPMMRFPRRSRYLLCTCSLEQKIAYSGLKKEQKASVVGPILKTCAHCFAANSCDIKGLQAARRSQNVHREIRTLWRTLARVRIRQARPAESNLQNFKRHRSVQFLVAGCCYCPRQDRVFCAGSVFHAGRVSFETQPAAISAQSVYSLENLTRLASPIPTFGPRASPSRFAPRSIKAAYIGTDHIPAEMRR
jgi:hypothetical protein